MKTKTLQTKNFNTSVTKTNSVEKINNGYHNLKTSVSGRVNKETLQVSLLYFLSILSISCWIISLKVLPFGDMFQFLLGAVVLSVNLLVFKYTKI